VFVTCLQRLAATAFALGITLLFASAYLRAAVSAAGPARTNAVLLATLPPAAALHAALSVLHAPPVLARIGLHTAAYTSLIPALGALFAGLGMWEVVM
jgi:hypothetical protein